MHPSLRELYAEMQKEGARRKKPAAPGTAVPQIEFPEGWKIPTDPRRQTELQMWQQWKESKEDPAKMEPLLKSLQPLVNKQVRVFSRTPIPTPVLQAEATKHTIDALRRYDPTEVPGRQTAQLHTWVTGQLRGMNRYVYKNQNMRRLTEERAQIVGDYQRAVAHLSETHGREPTHLEIADHINVSPDRTNRTRQIRERDVKLLSQENVPDLIASVEMDNPFVQETPQERELMKLIVYDLAPDELRVFEYIRGLNGKQKISSTGQIASLLGWSPSKVSQVKGRIAKKIDGYLK